MTTCLNDYDYGSFSIDDFVPDPARPGARSVPVVSTLTDLTARAITLNRMVDTAVRFLPKSFAPLLFVAALEEKPSFQESLKLVSRGQQKWVPDMVLRLLEHWPTEQLRFKDVWPSLRGKPEKTNFFVTYLFTGLKFLRSKSVTPGKLQYIDLVGLSMDLQTVQNLVVENTLPFYKDHNVYQILESSKVFKDLPVEVNQVFTSQIYREWSIICTNLGHLTSSGESFYPRKNGDGLHRNSGKQLNTKHMDASLGKSIVVIMDLATVCLKGPEGESFATFITSQCLRDSAAVPLCFYAAKVRIQGTAYIHQFDHLSYSDRMRTKAVNTLNIIDPKRLQGLSLHYLPKGTMEKCQNLLQRFSELKQLSIKHCCLQSAHRTGDQLMRFMSRYTSVFRTYGHLERLELIGLWLYGQLNLLLDGVTSPLRYLNLRECVLSDDDLIYLASSKQLNTIRELNLSDICKFIYNVTVDVLMPYRVSGEYETVLPPSEISLLEVVKSVACSPGVIILDLSKNLIPHSSLLNLANILEGSESLRCLKMSNMLLTVEECKHIVRSCVKISCFCGIVLSAKDVYTARGSSKMKQDNIQSELDALKMDAGRSDVRVFVTGASDFHFNTQTED